MTQLPEPSTVESDGDHLHVRYRDAEDFETLRTPEWAEKAAESVVDGGELRVGKRADGDDWVPVSVLVPEPAEPDEARRQAEEILHRIEH